MEAPNETRGLNWRIGRWIPWAEIEISQQTRGGPGGQHANRSATAIDLRWAPAASHAFSPAEQEQLVERISTKIDGHGRIRILASEERSASRNRGIALQRLADLIREALKPRRSRRATQPTRSSQKKRLVDKKNRSLRKQDRSRDFSDEI